MKKMAAVVLASLIASAAVAATQTVTFEVKGWSCGACASATKIALKKLDGVREVATDVEKSQLRVTYDADKLAPEKMIQAIEKLGYKATVKAAEAPTSPGPGKRPPANPPQSPERVSFFEVPLECGAADGLGCGSASKPLLKALEKDPRVKEAKINHPGTLLAVVWTEPEQARSGAAAVEGVFQARGLETELVRGAARDNALKEYGSGRWYGAADADRLSEIEAQTIATRLLNRAKLDLDPVKRAAITKDFSAGIAKVLTRDKDESCARDPFEELTETVKKHLTREQLAQLQKAAERGAGALPGEAR